MGSEDESDNDADILHKQTFLPLDISTYTRLLKSDHTYHLKVQS